MGHIGQATYRTIPYTLLGSAAAYVQGGGGSGTAGQRFWTHPEMEVAHTAAGEEEEKVKVLASDQSSAK